MRTLGQRLCATTLILLTQNTGTNANLSQLYNIFKHEETNVYFWRSVVGGISELFVLPLKALVSVEEPASA